jgi:hypothetical protein
VVETDIEGDRIPQFGDISVAQTIASGLAEGKIQKAPRPTAMKYTVPINLL